MKKLILSAAIILGSVSIYATANTTTAKEAKTEINRQSDYTEVSIDAVPAIIKAAVEKGYPGAKINKAYINEKKEYKLELSVGDQQATVFTDVNGNWLK